MSALPCKPEHLRIFPKRHGPSGAVRGMPISRVALRLAALACWVLLCHRLCQCSNVKPAQDVVQPDIAPECQVAQRDVIRVRADQVRDAPQDLPDDPNATSSDESEDGSRARNDFEQARTDAKPDQDRESEDQGSQAAEDQQSEREASDSSDTKDAHADTADLAAHDAIDAADGESTLPIINIQIEPGQWDELHDDPEAQIEVNCQVHIDQQTFSAAELELHGGFARTVPKKSYRLHLLEESDQPRRLDLFGDGREEIHRLVLQAAWIDPTFLRNKLIMDLIREQGGLAPRIGFATLCVNGQYHGLYTVVERIDGVYLDKQGFSRTANLYKAENHNANWQAKDNPMAGYDNQLDSDAPADDLADLLHALTYTPADEASFAAEVEPRLDLTDHRIFNATRIFAMDQDTFTKNYYLYHDLLAEFGTPEARFRIISWDADATFGVNWDGNPLALDETRWRGNDAFSPRLYGIPGYQRTYLEYFLQEMSAGCFESERLAQWIDVWGQRIGTAARQDLSHWQRDADFDNEIDRLKTAVRTRREILQPVLQDLLSSIPPAGNHRR